MSELLLQAGAAFLVTLLLLRVLSVIAHRVGLVDAPDHRKRHAGDVPLVGGLSIYLAMLLGALLWGDTGGDSLTSHGRSLWIFLLAGGLLVLAGTIDDLRSVSVFSRILTEVLVALLIIEGLDLRAENLGDLLGTGPIVLEGWVAYPFTVVCIFGVINAYNMLDGMDGVLGVITLITLFSFHLFTGTAPGLVTIFIGMALLAFLVSNLGLWPVVPKTFLGDAGSKREYNRRLFAVVAGRYDAVTTLLSIGRDRHWKRYLVNSLPKESVQEALDVACGTGDLTYAVAAHCPNARVNGLDLTP